MKAIVKAPRTIASVKGVVERGLRYANVAVGYKAEDFARMIVIACENNPDLLACSPKSVVIAVVQAAQLGLDCTGLLGEAALVPFKSREAKTAKATLIPMYRGLIKLAKRSGEVSSIEARNVYTGDNFELTYGLAPVLKHDPAITRDRGDYLGTYALARYKDGGFQVEFITKTDMEAIKATSRARDSGPWETNEDEMRRKSAVKRLAKYLPLSRELNIASEIEDEPERARALVELGEDVGVGDDDDAQPEAVETTKVDEVKAKIKAASA